MTEIISRGNVEITIVDLTDNRRLLSTITMNSPRYVIYNPDSSSYTPNYKHVQPTLTPYLKIEGRVDNIISSVSQDVVWSVKYDTNNPVVIDDSMRDTYEINPNTKELRILKNIMATYTFVTFFCRITYNLGNKEFITESTFELVKITNGTSGNDPIIAVLDNDFDNVHTRPDGSGGNYENLRTSISIFDGSVDVTSNWNISVETSGVEGILTRNEYVVSNMTADSGKVTFIARRNERRLERVYTLTKIKSGRDGEISRLYSDYNVIKKNADDVYSPNTILFKSQIKKGSGSWEELKSKFKVYTATGEENFNLVYESSKLEPQYNFSIPPNISNVKVEILDGKGVLIDTEYLPIVVDGKENIVAVIETPLGVASRNRNLNLEAIQRLFLGNTAISAESYKWYKMKRDESGDSDSGPGWLPLNDLRPEGTSGFHSERLIVSTNGILGTDTFMCVSYFNGRRFSTTVTFSDFTDPYSVLVLGSGLFRNGEGTNTYIAKLYQNGEEIDLDGSIYKYKWNLYDQEDRIVGSFRKEGKEITVSASEINNKAVLVCNVEEKQ